MKCIVCGVEVDQDRENRFVVDVASQRLVTCGPEHQEIARKNPEQWLNLFDSCC